MTRADLLDVAVTFVCCAAILGIALAGAGWLR